MQKNKLRSARHGKGETLREVCSKFHQNGITVNESMLSKVERFSYWPKRDLLTALKEHYDLSADDILFP